MGNISTGFMTLLLSWALFGFYGDGGVLSPRLANQDSLDTSSCVGMDEYLVQLRTIRYEYEEEIVSQFSPLVTDDASLTVSTIINMLPILNPQELKDLTGLLDSYIVAIETIIPPAIANNLHSELVKVFRLTANLSREINASGLASASESYSSILTSALANLEILANEAGSNCSSLSGTPDSIDSPNGVPTPQSVPGHAELKNVHDAIASQGATVEYGRQTVRTEGLTSVGQQLIVDDIPVYVFIFDNPGARLEQAGAIMRDAIKLKTPSGTDAATGDLIVSEGSNVLTISDGAPVDIQVRIEAAMRSLP